MADSYLNATGLGYLVGRLKAMFATKDEVGAVDAKVDAIVAEGGEPNVIEAVKVNGTALTPDAQKAVDVQVPTSVAQLSDAADYALASEVPTATSALDNDGDGTSPFATQAYVGTNGGKIDKITVNGTEQAITSKTVALTMPTKASDLANDSGYQTASDVSGSISAALANGSDPYATESDVASAISAAVAAAFTYKGAVATQGALPSSGNKVGDVYDVQDTGVNYAWSGSAWDPLGTYVDTSLYWAKSELSAVTTAEVDALFE